ncbi:MAG TPA: FAD-binding and (Fe-S)-binding domain-containing protein, partial [Solirubrobacteraceae bacterium]
MALLEPDVQRIAPAATEPATDRVPDWVARGTPEPLRSDLQQLLGADRVLARASDLVGYASDASPYRLLPQAVVMSHDVDDVRKVLAYGKRAGVPVTLRAAGTSLNGQAQTDGILVDVRRHWVGASVEDDGARLRVQPGMVLGHANRVLARHVRRLGPDPASTDAAAVGGVIANNSGGMRCGVTQDSYSTLRSMTLLLASGTLIDTAEPDAEARFAAAEPELAAGLEAIRDELRADSELTARVRSKFEIKNTTGYRLVAFLDADTPLEIFRRVVVGSEGTLAFVAEAVFDTVPVPPMTTVSWLHFPDIDAATAPVPDLVAAGATAVELMVAPALMVASHSIPGAPEHWRELPAESAALLIEFGADDAAGLDRLVEHAEQVLGAHELLRAPDFTRDREAIEVAWRVREGLFGLVGKLRPPGTALITEDVCVPPARMAESATDIQALLAEHGFLTGVAGHASAGNLHFMLSPSFADPADRERYESFISKLVDLIVDKYDGSLKAEHGTGRNMAPFVEREWGAKATEMMWRIKSLADPDGVLNPGAVLNRDPDVHLRDLKTTPEVEEEVTRCVECGFCEPVCPSRWLTTTPRQRIVLRREMARQPPGSPVLEALLAEYEHDAIQTCAADGSCKLACPLGIDTGAMIKDFRAQERTPRAQHNASRIAARWETVERGARAGLRAGAIAGRRPMQAGAAAARALFSDDLVPAWPANMPAPAPARLPVTGRESAVAVYLPA